MESKLINYSIFIEKRPDMEVHTEVAIVSCINSAYVLLDGECASLISQVDKFNMVDDRSQLDTTHELYRTDFELGQLQEALVFQVQYVLNMGNDFTVGGGSYSIGNINSSFSRPEGRELIAPGVYKLLSNARVYHLNAFGSFSNQNTNEIPLSTSKEIMERVKNEYVAQNQPNAQVGNVAYINQSKQVAFGSPQDLQITTYNTNRIAGPEGYRNNFYEIDSVPNIAFFGPDYNGTYSAVHRQEMIDYVNQNAGESLGQEIAQIKQEQEEQNTNIQTNTNEISAIKAKDIELENRIFQHENEIVRLDGWSRALDTTVQAVEQKVQTNKNDITALDSRLVSVSSLLNQTVDGLRTLRPFKFVGLYDSSRTYMLNEMVSKDNVFYLSLEDNNRTTPPSDKWIVMENFQQVDLSEYPTKLEVEAIKNNLQQSITSNTTNITNLNNEVVKIAGNQTITGAKTFDNQVIIRKDGTPLTLRAVNPGKIYMIMKGADDSANFSLGANSSNTSLEVNRGDLTIKTQQANKNIAFENAARIKFNRSVLEIGTEINAGFGGGEVKFIPEDNSTKTLQFYNTNPSDTRRFKLLVPDPTEAQNPATKQYVDNKVNTNTTNITTIRNNYLDKTATGNQQIAASSLYVQNQLVVNQPYNPILTPSADLHVSGQGYIENIEADNATFNTSVIVPTPTQNDHAANKAYVDNAIANSGGAGSGGSIDTSNFVTLNTIQTISGQKTFNSNITSNNSATLNGITTIQRASITDGTLTTVGTNANSLVNKQYVDTKANYRQVFSNTNTIWSNQQTTTIQISNYVNANNDPFRSWMIQFDRQGSNGNTYEGTFNLNFILPEVNKATCIDSSYYFNSSTQRFQDGGKVVITIHRINSNQLKLTFQSADGSNRFKNVKLLAPPA